MEVDAEKLLFLIEARSPIYNYKEKDHANKVIIEKLWNEIANELKCQVFECKGKWTSLRNAYARYLREERNKPSGSSGKQKRKWYLADAMSFVKDFVNQHRSTSSSLDTQELDENEFEISQVDSPATGKENDSSQSNSPIPRKKNKMSVSEMVAGPMIEFLQSKTKQKKTDNSVTMLFQSLACDYEKLSNKRQRVFRLHMITKMTELQEEEENEANNITTLSAVTMSVNDNTGCISLGNWQH